MIQELKNIEQSKLQELLANPSMWNSLDIDYCPPRVKRLWAPLENGYRISLHMIYPCEAEPLLHGHPWKSAIHVLGIGSGKYHHVLKYRKKTLSGEDNTVAKMSIEEVCEQTVSGEMYYEMSNPDSLHSVRPIGEPVYSIMLSGKPIFSENDVKATKELLPLTDEDKSELLTIFKNYFN